LVEPERPDLAAAALDRLLGDPAYAAALGEGALRTARTLTWDERAKRILAFLTRSVSCALRSRSANNVTSCDIEM